jgi:ADP-ribosyl-[dinitrogen reductase] hydrolase
MSYSLWYNISKEKIMDKADRIEGGFFGMIVGDALGVPFEFNSREELKRKPVKGMTGQGTHSLPLGTWSDDTSMALATIDALQCGYKPILMLDKFCEWLFGNRYTPHGNTFDNGGATEKALNHYSLHKTPCKEYDEFSNGNGSLMRILPVSLVFHELCIDDIVKINSEVSALTHGHPRSRIACSFYSLMIKHILEGNNFSGSHSLCKQEIARYIPDAESANFARITGGKIADISEADIKSDGYVIHTLEAALWCCLNTNSFKDAVLKAVNLGGDTDTVGALVGGLAGAFYGIKKIPETWIGDLAKLEDLREFYKKLDSSESNAPYHYKLLKSVKANIKDKINGLGVKKVQIAHSKIGGISEYDYIKLMGKPADLNEVLDFFNGMMFHGATITLEKGWALSINAYDGFKSLDRKSASTE